MMPFFNLFAIFFQIGFFGFGGGYAMLPMIFHHVQQFGIMTAAEFSRLVALSQVTPGPIAVNAATYVGYRYAGFGGALIATVAVVLPAFILVLISMHFIKKFEESKALDAVLYGIRPATLGLIASAVIFLAETSILNGPIISVSLFENASDYINRLPFAFFIGTIILAGKLKIGPIKLTLLAGAAGALFIR